MRPPFAEEAFAPLDDALIVIPADHDWAWLDADAVWTFARENAATPEPRHDEEQLHHTGLSAGRFCNYLLVLEALNFCFWDDEPRWRVPYRGKLHEETQTERLDSIRGVTGDVVWGCRNNMGRIFDGATREQELVKAFFHMPLKWRELFEKAKCNGIVNVSRKKCYEVELIHKNGASRRYFLDVDTMLPMMIEKILRGRGENTLTVQFRMDDYREVDGIQYPFRIMRNYTGDTDLIVEVQSIEHNVDLPADLFELPPEVKELQSSPSSARRSTGDENE